MVLSNIQHIELVFDASEIRNADSLPEGTIIEKLDNIGFAALKGCHICGNCEWILREI
ncbi:hypothetical protein D3C71_2021860 [compost metagenome]